jgi:putative Holliday junction resolvase
MPVTPRADRLLAFDYGLKRIGIAAGNCLTRTATPLGTLVPGAPPPWGPIDALIAEWQPDLIVVGEPGVTADPRLRAALEGFVAELGRRYARPVAAVDESHSSTAAAEELRAGRQKGLYNRRLQPGQVDQLAACLIAEQWMNQALERT